MVGIDDAILYSLPSQLTKSGIQKVKIAAALLKEADAYVLDEPSSYLSRKERLRVAHAIVSVIGPNKYIILFFFTLPLRIYLLGWCGYTTSTNY